MFVTESHRSNRGNEFNFAVSCAATTNSYIQRLRAVMLACTVKTQPHPTVEEYVWYAVETETK